MAMGAIRARNSIDEAAGYLAPLGGSHLRSGEEMARVFAQFPEAVTAAADLGEQCAFELALIAPQLPPFDVPDGHTEDSWLRHLVMTGARNRYGPPERARRAYEQIEHELKIIEQLTFPGYFLVVHDITRFCRENGILAQGRGSAANSAVCYALGVTNVDPVANELLFERFLSPARDGPPDIDIDIESDLREKAIQYVYDRYGRDYAAQVANVITYRGRSAVRDMARALGFSQGQQDAWSKQIGQWGNLTESTHVEDVPEPVIDLAMQISNLPRHMGIHSGGMVICDRPIADVCPVEWARMENRSVLQWDKDDCAAIGLVKFDMLGLGMLSALHYCIDLVAEHKGIDVDLAKLDLSEQAVYEMLQRADSVGVFQVESRAQMATLPRLKPRVFYDLVVEVALIRPGPIQGGSVHPYIKRRNGEEQRHLRPSIDGARAAKNVGRPAVSGAAHAAGGRLRRLLRRRGRPVAPRDGVQAVDRADAQAARPVLRRHARTARHHRRCGRPDLREAGGVRQLRLPGKPFTVFCLAGVLLVVVQAAPSRRVLRRAAAGAADGLLLTADVGGRCSSARSHRARAGCQRQPGARDAGEVGTEVRLGIGSVRHIGDELAEQIAEERKANGPFRSLLDLTGRVQLSVPQTEALATAGALACFGITRREGLWAAGAAATQRPDRLPGVGASSHVPTLPGMTELELAASDVWATGISPDSYPTQFLRADLDAMGVIPADRLLSVPDGTRVLVAGAVTHRQRPATAQGVTFINLEDETGMVNILCSQGVWKRHRKLAQTASAMVIRGQVQNATGAVTVVAERLGKLDMRVASRRPAISAEADGYGSSTTAASLQIRFALWPMHRWRDSPRLPSRS